jgi:hypothetical protein
MVAAVVVPVVLVNLLLLLEVETVDLVLLVHSVIFLEHMVFLDQLQEDGLLVVVEEDLTNRVMLAELVVPEVEVMVNLVIVQM